MFSSKYFRKGGSAPPVCPVCGKPIMKADRVKRKDGSVTHKTCRRRI